ncbi:MAG: sugar ABC transporter permease [Albidovulum sp.]|nr:sugar ABC transporter permease [Albidovulum sp.]MDE0306004.1 sugar ABC transporter permease [Albidovulum sp.]
MREIVRGAPETYPEWFQNKSRTQPLIVSRWVPVFLVGVPVLVLLAIVIYPTIWMFYHSLRDTNIQGLFMGNHQYHGFKNYATVVSSERFQDSLLHLLQYLTFGACLQVVLGTILALTLYEFVRSNAARTAILILMVLPMMLPPSIVGVLWRFLLTPSNGAVNQALLNLGLISKHIEWFNAGISLWSIILADIWNWTALPLLIVYSGRVSLPVAVYEAARVDGAGRWKVMRRITLPMLKEVIAIAFILRFTDAFKFVDLVYVMTSGGPAQSSELPTYIAFQRGIREFAIGEAAAYAIVIFAISAVIITLFLKYMKRVMKAQGLA